MSYHIFSFPIHNRVLRWKDIDDEYCISFVYRGDYGRSLYRGGGATDMREYVVRDETASYFLDIDPAEVYWIEIAEDPVAGVGVEGLTLREGPVKTDMESGSKLTSGNRAFRDISAQLRSINTSELNSEEARDLRERRDIEDVLFSSTGYR